MFELICETINHDVSIKITCVRANMRDKSQKEFCVQLIETASKFELSTVTVDTLAEAFAEQETLLLSEYAQSEYVD